jgi:hypothetical protein
MGRAARCLSVLIATLWCLGAAGGVQIARAHAREAQGAHPGIAAVSRRPRLESIADEAPRTPDHASDELESPPCVRAAASIWIARPCHRTTDVACAPPRDPARARGPPRR